MEMEKEPFPVLNESETRVQRRNGSCMKKRLWISCLIVIGILIIMAGTAFVTYTIRFSNPCEKILQTSTLSPCEFSKEARRINLENHLRKMKFAVMKYHPNMVAFLPGIDEKTIRNIYKPFDNHPLAMKEKDDKLHELYKEIVSLDIDEKKLKTRERKALAQLQYFYNHSLGQPTNYYTGEWMLGPNLFCWHVICFMGNDLGYTLKEIKPRSIDDVRRLQSKLEEHKDAIMQYLKNIRLGVEVGMVGSTEECRAGIDSFKQHYIQIATAKNGSGILKEWFMDDIHKEPFFNLLSDEDKKKWQTIHNKTVKESIHEYIVQYVGEPLYELIRYLEEEHIRHCVPANISSGFSSRPVSFVYNDGKENKSQPTTKRLPTGEVIDGKKSYKYFLSFYLSTDMSAADVHRLGRQQIKKIYPKIVELAKTVTREADYTTALEKFKNIISASKMYFNEGPFPANESDKKAHEKCINKEEAIQFCPTRWKSMQEWFSMAREVMNTILPETVKLFYFTGKNKTIPACPLELQPDFNPSSSTPSYLSSNHECTWTCKYNIPFFLDNMGPKYTEITTSAHEASPGHHTQVQGAMEHFQDSCGDLIGWLTANIQSYALSEGWGLYSESALIGEETDIYENEPLQKYGMLKMQMWRAIRMVVDTGLHSLGMTRTEALDLFEEYAWDSSDMAMKEVTRYQSCPGQSVSYMVGQLEILRLRKYAEEKLGDKFSLAEFHYHILSQESSPLFYMDSHIKQYVKCKLKNYTLEGCFQLFQGSSDGIDKAKQIIRGRGKQWPPRHIIRRYV